MTIEELQKRINNITTEELITIHKIERDYEYKLTKLQDEKEINFNKWKQRVTIALIENGYEVDEVGSIHGKN